MTLAHSPSAHTHRDADRATVVTLPRMNLCKTDCVVRDDRWEVRITADDDPVSIRVVHRMHGDFYDWPEAVFDAKIKAALRAYDLTDNEVTFHTRGRALAAGHAFLKSYGAGDVEYLEWDINSQSMVVVGHSGRGPSGLWWPEAKADPLAPFYKATTAPEAGAVGIAAGDEPQSPTTREGADR